MQLHVPENSPTSDPQLIKERDSQLIWKLKTMATKTSFALFVRYGIAEFVEESDKEFHQYLLKYHRLMFDAHVNIIRERKEVFVGT